MVNENVKLDPIGLVAGSGLVLSWTFPGVLIRLLPAIPGFEVFFWRLAFAGLALFLWMGLRPASRQELWAGVTSLQAWLISPLMVVYYLLAVFAFQSCSVIIVALIISSSPVVLLILRSLRGASVVPRELAGVGCAMLGLTLCLGASALKLGGPAIEFSWIGVMLAFICTLCSASFVLLRSSLRALTKVSGQATATMTCFWGVPLFAAYFLLEPKHHLELGLETWSLALLLALGVGCTAVPTLCYAVAAARLPPLLTSMFNLMVPICAGIAASLVLGETPSFVVLPAAAMTLFGIWLVAAKPR